MKYVVKVRSRTHPGNGAIVCDGHHELVDAIDTVLGGEFGSFRIIEAERFEEREAP